MDAFQLIFLLLASSRWLIHPIDGAIRENSSGKESQIASSAPGFVKDVLAQIGGKAKLPCRFTGPGIVTWIRRKSSHVLLTVGRRTHSVDTRFSVVQNSPDWSLLIKNVKHEDAGLYECQIQTEPVQKRFVRLNITEAYSVIPGAPDLHVKQGSSLRLECQFMAATEPPSFTFWYRQERMINYDCEPGVRVEATKNGSILIVDKVKLSHGANYTCSPSNARPAYIMIHVIEEEEKPAAMHGGDRRNCTSGRSVNVILISLTLLAVLGAKRYRQEFFPRVT
ncbi:hypothetical protein KM043_018209 [Ampulex compressa]|nr:hypothetical protein KM043_018209 [Ampulex compressa]